MKLYLPSTRLTNLLNSTLSSVACRPILVQLRGQAAVRSTLARVEVPSDKIRTGCKIHGFPNQKNGHPPRSTEAFQPPQVGERTGEQRSIRQDCYCQQQENLPNASAACVGHGSREFFPTLRQYEVPPDHQVSRVQLFERCENR